MSEEATTIASDAPAPRWDDAYPVLAGLPAIGEGALKAASSKLVREYARAVLVDPALKRQFGIGMGIVTFKRPIVVTDGKDRSRIEMIEVEAEPAVQQRALQAIIQLGIPQKVEGDTGTLRGVIVLGEAGLIEARRRGDADRLAATGPPRQLAGYVPPPGFTTLVIEDDLSGASPAASPDDAPPPPSAAAPEPTRAQQLAAKRRSRPKK